MEDKNKTTKKNYIDAIGRRKESTARVRLYLTGSALWGEDVVKKGEIFVNQKKAEEYFGKNAIKVYSRPLIRANLQEKFAITVKVAGGGKSGQIRATVLAIARAIDKYDPEKFHSILKKERMLIRDPRVRERRKVGMGGKARRRKQSPKR